MNKQHDVYLCRWTPLEDDVAYAGIMLRQLLGKTYYADILKDNFGDWSRRKVDVTFNIDTTRSNKINEIRFLVEGATDSVYLRDTHTSKFKRFLEWLQLS